MSKADCRKFAPNVFNKNKCASCFKAKEEHSDEALENNRASRKVAKCGYLFAAPDWDFSNPINRTKRWQRRWFVLYDDGELTYSVDEHPETVPQAIIDMNRVVEVSEAEEVTGHSFSLALTAADRVHFLKGTSREESKWWFDILSMFPRTNMKTGRHKRNATFPGSKATTIISTQTQHQQSTAPNSPCLSKGVSIQPFQTPPMARPRFHSQTESLTRTSGQNSGVVLQNFNSLPVKDTNGRNGQNGGSGNNKTAIEEDDIIPVKEGPFSVSSTIVATSSSNSLPSKIVVPAEKDILIVDKDFDEKIKTRRVIRREIRGARSARCNSEILTSLLIQPSSMNTSTNTTSSSSNSGSNVTLTMANSSNNTTGKGYALVLPSSTLTAPIGSKNNAGLSSCSDRPRSALLPPVPPPTASPAPAPAPAPRSPVISSNPHSPFYLYMADVPRNRHYESLESLQHAFTNINSPSRARHSSSKDTPDSISHNSELATPVSAKDRPISMHELGSASVLATSRTTPSYESCKLRPSERPIRQAETINPPGEAVRGDPDGCGLDPVTSFCSPLPDRRSTLTLTTSLLDESLKKGWLLRLSYGAEWKKYWLVLRCNILSLYRDHAAEDVGLADETVDLSQIASVEETDSGRSYGFQLVALDGKRHSLAALTSGIRTQWIQALRNACNQGKMAHLPMKLASANAMASLKAVKENVDPAAPRREADDDSYDSYDGSSTEEEEELDEDDHLNQSDKEDSPVPEPIQSLPPSPPLNRTPMSKVKERDRSRSSSRSRSRHRSASPSSVRTLSPPAAPSVPLAPASLPSEPVGGQIQIQIRLDAAKGEITRLLNERREQEREAQQQLVTLNARLADKEQQMNRLAGILEATKAESQRQLLEIRNLLEAKEAELKSLREESLNSRTENSELRENLKRERSEVYKLRDVAQELRSLLDSRNDTLNQLQSKTDEVELLNRRLKAAQDNLSQTQERLQRGIDENEGLFARLRQMEENRGVNNTGQTGGSTLRRSRSSTGSMPLPLQLCSRNLLGGSSKKSLPRLDSLSDLSNIDYDLDLDNLDRESLIDEYVELRARFERSLVEIRALKRELRQTQSALDGFEVAHMALKQQWQAKEGDYTSQLSLMAARVQDLTAKMAAADKQVRQLKIKVAKSESREKRRTQSLKGRESFQLSKEVEDKLVDLEQKMAALGSGGATPSSSAERESPPSRARKGFEEPTKSFRMRRKSLEGGAVAGSDSVKILLRVDQLEQQLAGRQGSGKKASGMERKNSLPGRSPQGKPPRSSPLKVTGGLSAALSVKRSTDSPDGTIARPSKIVQDLEQCVVELELVFNSNKVDGQNLIGKIRNIQQDLLNPDRVRVASPSDGPSQVEKIQDLLRVRLSELKVKRDHVRSLGKLDSAAVSQIAAEKLALELAIAEQLSTVGAAKQPEEKEMLRDANWTIHKLGWLKRKLSGEKSAPALDQSTSFGTYCAALAERLSAIAAVSSTSRSHQSEGGADQPASLSILPARVAHHLAEEERDLSLLFSKYKEEKLQELARLLAHETLRMGDSPSADNQLVEEVKVREAWLEAQEIANKELVDSEVRQAMTRMAEVFAEDVADEERLAAALLLWPAQQLQYEQRCQVVEEVLRSEMEEAVLLLSNAYERSLQQMKAQSSNGGLLHPPEGDLEAALSEFAEVVAHKALIDGHIAVLQGETPSQPLATTSGSDSSLVQNISIIQETEGIISSLCHPDFFPAALNCGEVAAILHRNLVEPRNKSDDSSSSAKEERNSNSSVINEEMIRQKYQAEIEQLRALTEKGMSAMEGSHKRIIAQMEEKHQQDLNRLQVEKERALAEETQATLAALDAMRKAHEAEVQREIARFKEEFFSQMAARQAPPEREMTPNREQEMEEIRRQILSLSEKYSHKCLESAALEQKVSSLSQQMAVSQRQILDLDSRNQQLRSFLDTGTVDQQPDASPAEVLRAKESQLLMLQEDVAELQFCLRESQSREEELASMARNLGQYLRTERTLQSDEVTALRHRLEDLLLLSGPSSAGSGGTTSSSILGRKNSSSDDKNSPSRDSPPRESIRFHYVRSKDLTRSPSCPRLSGFLSLAPRLSTRPVLPPRDPIQGSSGSSNHH